MQIYVLEESIGFTQMRSTCMKNQRTADHNNNRFMSFCFSIYLFLMKCINSSLELHALNNKEYVLWWKRKIYWLEYNYAFYYLVSVRQFNVIHLSHFQLLPESKTRQHYKSNHGWMQSVIYTWLRTEIPLPYYITKD